MPQTAYPYELDKVSPPPPLVEGALYGAYIPKSIYPTFEFTPSAVELAWHEPAWVFFPGVNSNKESKTECWFFPFWWAGRVSDKGHIALLPLLRLGGQWPDRNFTYSLKGLPPFTPVPRDEVAWKILEPKDFGARVFVSAGNYNTTEKIIDLIKGATDDAGISSELSGAISDFPGQGKDDENPGFDSFPRTASPYIIPNVPWDGAGSVVEYMNACGHALTEAFGEEAGMGSLSVSANTLFSDFGSTEAAEQVIEQTIQKIRSSADPGGRWFTWWGMAHTQWLNAHKELIQVKALGQLDVIINQGHLETDTVRRFSVMGFPFANPTGIQIIRGEAFRTADREVMTPAGKAFYDKVIAPAMEATQEGFVKPTLTLEEAQVVEEDTREAEKAARDAAGGQGDASKNVTATRNALEKAVGDLSKATEDKEAAQTALAEFKEADDYTQLEKYRKQVADLREMLDEEDIPKKLIKGIEDLEKKLGKDFKKAQEAVEKTTKKEATQLEKSKKAKTERDEAETLLEKVQAAHEDAEEALKKAVQEVGVIKALSTYLYVPSYSGYAQFLTDVRAGYDATATPDISVAAAFKWFSGSPQSVVGQTGRWSAGSAWEKAKVAAGSAAGDRPTMGQFRPIIRRPTAAPRPLAGPIDVDRMDGEQVKMQVGRPSKMVPGSYVVVESLAGWFANEFQPLFDAYTAKYPKREVDEGNLVFEVTEKAVTTDEGRWEVGIQPVAFFDESYTPIAPFEGTPEVKDVPTGETKVTFDGPDASGFGGDDFVMVPRKAVLAGGTAAPSKNPISPAAEAWGDEWEFRRGDYGGKSLVKPDGTSSGVKVLGKGTFATVYEILDEPKKVIIEVPDDIYDKEIVAEVYRQQEGRKNPHLPRIVQLGDTRTGKLYLMDRYKMPLRKADTKHWKDYQALRACWDEALGNVRRKAGDHRQFMYSGHEILHETVVCAKKRKVKKSLRDALEDLRDWTLNYGSSYTFEISPRNVGSDAKGNLVLVDVLFDMEKLGKARGRNSVLERLNVPSDDGLFAFPGEG
jgi:hypothetical protein